MKNLISKPCNSGCTERKVMYTEFLGERLYYVVCSCGKEGPYRLSVKAAIKSWNAVIDNDLC